MTVARWQHRAWFVLDGGTVMQIRAATEGEARRLLAEYRTRLVVHESSAQAREKGAWVDLEEEPLWRKVRLLSGAVVEVPSTVGAFRPAAFYAIVEPVAPQLCWSGLVSIGALALLSPTIPGRLFAEADEVRSFRGEVAFVHVFRDDGDVWALGLVLPD